MITDIDAPWEIIEEISDGTYTGKRWLLECPLCKKDPVLLVENNGQDCSVECPTCNLLINNRSKVGVKQMGKLWNKLTTQTWPAEEFTYCMRDECKKVGDNTVKPTPYIGSNRDTNYGWYAMCPNCHNIVSGDTRAETLELWDSEHLIV